MFCVVSSSQSNCEQQFWALYKNSCWFLKEVKLEKLTKKNARKNCSPSFVGGSEEQNQIMHMCVVTKIIFLLWLCLCNITSQLIVPSLYNTEVSLFHFFVAFCTSITYVQLGLFADVFLFTFILPSLKWECHIEIKKSLFASVPWPRQAPARERKLHPT